LGPSLLLVGLNRTAEAFIFPPSKVYLDAVAEDFRRSQVTTIPNLVNHLFLTTALYLLEPIDKPAGYRNKSPNQIIAILEKHRYFHLWRSVNHAVLLCFWAANLALLAVLAQMRKKNVAAVASRCGINAGRPANDGGELRSQYVSAALYSSHVGANNSFHICLAWPNT